MKTFWIVIRAIFVTILIGAAIGSAIAIMLPYISITADFRPGATTRPVTAALGEAAFILEFLKISLTTAAFVTALYALYSKDTRLRASGEWIFIALLLFILAALLFVFSLLLTKFTSPGAGGLARAAACGYTAILFYVAGILTLFLLVFLPTYNQLYNLRTTKAIRSLKPIRLVREYFKSNQAERKQRYELNVEKRPENGDFLGVFKEAISAAELQQLRSGAAILLVGDPTLQYINAVAQLCVERLNVKETANYVCCHRPPAEIWPALKGAGIDTHLSTFVIIDAFTRNFGFTDEIHRDRIDHLQSLGVKQVPAKSFAGLHSATNRAFNIIKDQAVLLGTPGKRVPMLMVYDHTSVLCDFESKEQFAVFWRHVIPSERTYGMITLIIEDDCTPKECLSVLRQLVDVTIRVKATADSEGASIKFVREQ